MLAKLKWLIAALCFVVQFMVLPLVPVISVYPDVALAGVCALALVYGPVSGMLCGLCAGVISGTLVSASLLRPVLTYALLGMGCGFMSFKSRASRVALPLIAVGLSQVVRQLVDIAYLAVARAYFDLPTLFTRLTVSTLLTMACALPVYWLMHRGQHRYRVIGKRVGI